MQPLHVGFNGHPLNARHCIRRFDASVGPSKVNAFLFFRAYQRATATVPTARYSVNFMFDNIWIEGELWVIIANSETSLFQADCHRNACSLSSWISLCKKYKRNSIGTCDHKWNSSARLKSDRRSFGTSFTIGSARHIFQRSASNHASSAPRTNTCVAHSHRRLRCRMHAIWHTFHSIQRRAAD